MQYNALLSCFTYIHKAVPKGVDRAHEIIVSENNLRKLWRFNNLWCLLLKKPKQEVGYNQQPPNKYSKDKQTRQRNFLRGH